jgi:hypothetical protein
MPLRPSHSENRRLVTRRRISFVLFALALASPFIFILGYHWHLRYWLYTSIAVPPSSARSAEDIDAIAARLAAPPGFSINTYAMGLGQARVMVLTPKGDIILSSPPSKVLLVKKDSRGNGRSDGVETLLSGLHNPSGLFLDGDQLYIAGPGRHQPHVHIRVLVMKHFGQRRSRLDQAGRVTGRERVQGTVAL